MEYKYTADQPHLHAFTAFGAPMVALKKNWESAGHVELADEVLLAVNAAMDIFDENVTPRQLEDNRRELHRALMNEQDKG